MRYFENSTIQFQVSTNDQILFVHYFRVESTLVPSVANGRLVELGMFGEEEGIEEFDNTIREARFAFRSTDLPSWIPSSVPAQVNTDTNPKIIQHWALVIHFPRGKFTYVFEAWKDKDGFLQAGRTDGLDYKVFEEATYFGSLETSPYQLVEKAKVVPKGLSYHAIRNNCQTWLMCFLTSISTELLDSLHSTVPNTKRSN